jgi:transcriptional regulator with XRE-family HTH domain
MTRTELGTLLKSKRGVTKHKLHKLSGLSRTQIDKIEAGATNYTVDSLLLYCEHSGIKLLAIKNQ